MVEVSTAADLKTALGTSGTAKKVVLGADISVDGTDNIGSITAMRTVTLDLNGHTIKASGSIYSDAKGWYGVLQAWGPGTHLTVVNTADTGGVEAYLGDSYGIYVYNGAECTLNLTNETAVVGGSSHALYIGKSGGTIAVNGGHYSLTHGLYNTMGENPNRLLINCYDAAFTEGSAEISVSKGLFDGFNPGEAYSEPAQPISLLTSGTVSVKTETPVTLYYTDLGEDGRPVQGGEDNYQRTAVSGEDFCYIYEVKTLADLAEADFAAAGTVQRPDDGPARDSNGVEITQWEGYDAAYAAAGITFDNGEISVDQAAALALIADTSEKAAAVKSGITRYSGSLEADAFVVGIAVEAPDGAAKVQSSGTVADLAGAAAKEIPAAPGDGEDTFKDENGADYFIWYLPAIDAEGNALEEEAAFVRYLAWTDESGAVIKIEKMTVRRNPTTVPAPSLRVDPVPADDETEIFDGKKAADLGGIEFYGGAAALEYVIRGTVNYVEMTGFNDTNPEENTGHYIALAVTSSQPTVTVVNRSAGAKDGKVIELTANGDGTYSEILLIWLDGGYEIDGLADKAFTITAGEGQAAVKNLFYFDDLTLLPKVADENTKVEVKDEGGETVVEISKTGEDENGNEISGSVTLPKTLTAAVPGNGEEETTVDLSQMEVKVNLVTTEDAKEAVLAEKEADSDETKAVKAAITEGNSTIVEVAITSTTADGESGNLFTGADAVPGGIQITIGGLNPGQEYRVFCISDNGGVTYYGAAAAGDDGAITFTTKHLCHFAAVEDNDALAEAVRDMPVETGTGLNGSAVPEEATVFYTRANEGAFDVVTVTGTAGKYYIIQATDGKNKTPAMIYCVQADETGTVVIRCSKGSVVMVWECENAPNFTNGVPTGLTKVEEKADAPAPGGGSDGDNA